MSTRYCRKKDSLDLHILTPDLLAAGCVECDAKGRIPETVVQPPEEAPAPAQAAPPASGEQPGKPEEAPAPKRRGGRPKSATAANPPQA